MKISVVVPVYNVEPYLEECLESIINQTYKNLEIILVDDGSTDNSGKICDRYAERDSRIIVIHKKNGGLVSARKRGVALATGEYVSYVDSDDWIDTTMYEALIKKLSESKADVIAFGYYKEYENRTVSRNEYLIPDLYYKEQLEYIINQFLLENDYFYTPLFHLSVWSKLFRTSIIQKKQQEINDMIRMGEDIVAYACVLEAESIQIVDNCFYHYRVRKDSIVHKRTENEFQGMLELARYVNVLLKKHKVLRPLAIQYLYLELSVSAIELLFQTNMQKISLYPDLQKGNRIIVYGKGNIGTSLYNYIKITDYYKIVDWIDTFDINRLSVINENSYDYIIIAITIPEIVKSVEQSLLALNIPVNKIMKIEPKKLLEEDLPKEIRSILMNE